MNKKGMPIWQIVLLTIFLAIAVGSSLFFFLLNSEDARKARTEFAWIESINETLDKICLEIANAAVIEYPFSGETEECFFRPAMNSGHLLPTTVKEGFSFSNNSFVYIKGSGTRQVTSPQKFSNPLINDCKGGKFIRKSSDCLEIKFRAAAPDNSGLTRTFRRKIFLRNL
ncbi:MAG: hypothetical protein ACQETH_06950 [Candidatus Rifleibacteriota bacterium]